MREFKYRVYVTKTKEMLTWEKLQRIKQFALDDGIKPKDVILIPVNEGTDLMQFIGLQDKHGEDIYEGDIIEYTYLNEMCSVEQFTVEYEAPAFKFRSHKDNQVWGLWEYDIEKQAEIIGNRCEGTKDSR